MKFQTRIRMMAAAALCGVLVVGGAGPSLAQDAKSAESREKPRDDARQGGGKRKAGSKPAPGMTKAREAAALAFVEEHHPQLAELLVHLKQNQPRQYEAAIRDLFRTSERLANFHERDRARYELELEHWKLKSRVHLLTATAMMSPDSDEIQDRLKSAIREQLSVRRELLILDRDRTAQRLKRLETQIEQIEGGADRIVDRQLKFLLERKSSKRKSEKERAQDVSKQKQDGRRGVN